VVLRNPIDRAMSEYLEWNMLHTLRHQPLLPSFSEMVLNKQYIANWLRVFGREQMCFVDEHEDPYEVMQAHEQCMELSPFSRKKNIHKQAQRFYCFVVGRRKVCMDKSKGRIHPEIPEGTLTKLKTSIHGTRRERDTWT